MWVEALNPKTAAFFLAFIPQFIDPTQQVAQQFLLLGMISVMLNTTADIIVAYGAGRARDALEGQPTAIVQLRRISATILCALGAVVFITVSIF